MPERRSRSSAFKRYAVEFLVVFFGVWLSLLAQQWRQGREDRNAAQLALQGIVEDLQVDLEDMRGNLARARLAFEAADWLVSRRAGPSPSEDSVSLALTEIGPCSFPQWNMSQYSTLKSSGEINLIRDELRSNITEYYESRPGLNWLHERDCDESSAVYELLVPLVTLAIPPDVPALGRTPEFSAQVTGVPDVPGLFRDPVIMDRVVKLASHRQFLIMWIGKGIEKAQLLHGVIITELEDR
ncbi:MAG: hypothetical protein DRI30_05645 [Chloroflexi bacterium]|nr:MAG: hypothetical protein DRI30_05645 [Chloroflexota bacterium]